MPFSAETALPSHILKRVARPAIAVMLSIGLAGCGGGGGSGGGEQVMIVPDPQVPAPAPRPPAPEPPPPAEPDPPLPAARLPNPAAPVTASTRPGPDLVVSSAYVSKTNPFASEHLSVGATVRNAGDRTAAATWVYFWFSKDTAITRFDVPAGSKSTNGSIAPSEKRYLREDSVSPSLPGVYYYGVCVDAVAGESETGNNCLAAERVTVRRPPSPDIVLGSPSAYPASPIAGGVFALRARMRNTGRKTGAVRMRYYRSDDATFTSSDPQVGTYWEGEMFTKSSRQSSMILDSPDDPGTYYYRVCADVVAGESDTTNNCSAALKVEVKRSRPNLQFFSVSRGSWNGSRFELAAGVRNIGGPSPETTMRFYHSTDRKITTDDTELLSVAVPALRKTQSQTIPQFYSPLVLLPGPTTTGWHYYGACVDAVADESDTTDNCTYIHRIIRK